MFKRKPNIIKLRKMISQMDDKCDLMSLYLIVAAKAKRMGEIDLLEEYTQDCKLLTNQALDNILAGV